jgi:HEAT repeat protein
VTRLFRKAPDPSERLATVLSLPDDAGGRTRLVDAVSDVSLDVARAALRRLTPLAGAAEIVALRGRMLDVDLGLVADVARTLRALGDTRASDAALAALNSPLASRRHRAAIALRELRDPAARAALVRAVDDREPAVRRVALEALLRLSPDAEAIKACVRRLTDRDPLVRAAAVTAVATLAPDPSEALRSRLTDRHPTVRTALAVAAAALDEHEARALLRDPETKVRVALLETLARQPRPELLSSLEDALADPSWHVRRAACDALGAIERPGPAAHLLHLLVDPSPTVQKRALLALERLLGDELDDALEAGLTRDNAPLRRAIVEILGLRGHVEMLPRLAEDPDTDVRVALVHALATAGSQQGRAALDYLADDSDPAVRNAVEVVLQAPRDA